MKSLLAIAALSLMISACNEKKEASSSQKSNSQITPQAVKLSPAEQAADEEAKKVEKMEEELDALLNEI